MLNECGVFFAPADYEFAKIQSTNTSIAFLSAGPIVFRPAAATLLQSVRVGH